MTTNPSVAPHSMPEALGRLWTKFLPEIENRVGLLEAAVRSLESGSISGDEREAAHQAAHKLAGILGTFGLPRGTDLARQAELAFAEENTDSAAALSSWIAELRALIESRK